MLLTFHPSQIQIGASNGSKLPLTVYESVYEGDNAAGSDKAMQVDNEEQSLIIRFRELPYSIETGEAEMIGVDTVARSARNAASDTGAASQQETQTKGKKEQKDVMLSPEEEERTALSSPSQWILSFQSANSEQYSGRQPQHPPKRRPNP